MNVHHWVIGLVIVAVVCWVALSIVNSGAKHDEHFGERT